MSPFRIAITAARNPNDNNRLTYNRCVVGAGSGGGGGRNCGGVGGGCCGVAAVSLASAFTSGSAFNFATNRLQRLGRLRRTPALFLPEFLTRPRIT